MATRIDSEFLVNESTGFTLNSTGFTLDSTLVNPVDVAINAQGEFVAVWSRRSLNNTLEQSVVYRLFDADGDPDSGDVVVDTVTNGLRLLDPDIGLANDGRIIVVWEEDGSFGGRIVAQIYQSDGDIEVPEFSITTDSSNLDNFNPALAIDPDTANFVVTWIEVESNGDRNIVAQRFESDGDQLGDEILVETIDDNDFDDGERFNDPEIAMDGAGNFIIVWSQNQNENNDNSFDIFAKRYNTSGNVLNNTFLVNTQQEASQVRPDIATDTAGDFTIVWESAAVENGDNAGIYARRYDSTGNSSGLAFTVFAPDIDDGLAFDPAIAMDGDGDTLISWTNLDQDNLDFGNDIFAQQYDNTGNAIDAPFRVNDNEDEDGNQNDSAIALASDGDGVVVWRGDAQGADVSVLDQDVFGQRLTLNTGDGTTTNPDTTTTDILTGTDRGDRLLGGSGSDTIRGNNGNDVIRGKQGDDIILGNNGRDRLFGDNGIDDISGGNGRDLIDGGGGNDLLKGGAGNDRLTGGPGSDCLTGGGGQDELRGGSGINVLNGGKGRDTLIGGLRGADVFVLLENQGFDIIRGFTRGRDSLGFLSGRQDLFEVFRENVALTLTRSGTIVSLNGRNVALVQGVDLTDASAADIAPVIDIGRGIFCLAPETNS